MLGLAAVVCLAVVHPVASQQRLARDPNSVYIATLEGVINPLSASYLIRALSRAQDEGAQVLVLQLDTPGGLDTSMRVMTQTMLAAQIPVIVYVAPSGARAASAGMFITVAAHVAAMAPGTNIGAAHPVALGGGDETASVMEDKLVEDAAATARSLATLRGRNAEWAEQAVRQSLSATAEEALEKNVIDLIAPTLDELLNRVDGRTVEVAERTVTLRTRGATQVPIPMSFLEVLLHIITDPNIAYLLMSIGVIGIIAELYNPGSFIPGIVGVISLALAFVALGTLPIGWAGVALLLLAVGLMIGELESEGFGALGIGAIVAFVIGSLLLFVPLTPVSPSLPTVRVSPWVIGLMTISLVLFLTLVVGKAVQARKQPVRTGIEGLVGQYGKAVTNLDPSGRVNVIGEEWSAEAAEGSIEAGTIVEIVDVSGVVLKVRPKSAEGLVPPPEQ